MEYPIYTGDDARRKVDHLLTEVERGKSQYQLRNADDRCCGYFQDGNRWIVFNNRTNECWTEEFRSEKRCRKYLNVKNSNKKT